MMFENPMSLLLSLDDRVRRSQRSSASSSTIVATKHPADA
jgi:hypothetical protein